MYILFYSKAKDAEARYLSNFQPSSIVFRGTTFPSVEHAFQAAKFLYSNKPELFNFVAQLDSALEAKRYGGKTNFTKLGAVLDQKRWNAESATIMEELITIRYNTDAKFKAILDKAQDSKLELYHYERPGRSEPYWGGYFKDNKFIGNNKLGQIMMNLQ